MHITERGLMNDNRRYVRTYVRTMMQQWPRSNNFVNTQCLFLLREKSEAVLLKLVSLIAGRLSEKYKCTDLKILIQITPLGFD